MGLLRIAVVLPHLGVYGGIRRFLELGRVWLARGHEVALLIPEWRGPELPWLPFTGRIGTHGDLGRSPWDVLLSPDPALFLQARAAGALRVFYAVLERAPGAEAAWRAADLVLANSAGMRRHLAKRGVRAVDAAGGVNVDFFRPEEPDLRRERAGARAGARAPVHVLVYGRLSRRRKGTLIAARAVESAARSAGVACKLTLFDNPPGKAPAAKDLPVGIPQRWVLRPTQEVLRALYADADLFVSAERRAGWSNTAAEAMASGAAVVCTKSGTEDFAVDGETAAVARWPWSWAIARKIAPLLLDPAARLALAARGRERMRGFSWERTAERIEGAIEARLGERAHA